MNISEARRYPITVSYTHLDVYKRQSQNRFLEVTSDQNGDK
ncbi:hypothetical protein AZZ65_004797 [Escherichia coli]|nr:hypothetical protein AZZ65_004797 [Escherichia coli]